MNDHDANDHINDQLLAHGLPTTINFNGMELAVAKLFPALGGPIPENVGFVDLGHRCKTAIRNDLMASFCFEMAEYLSGNRPAPELIEKNLEGIDAYYAGVFMGCPVYIQKDVVDAIVSGNDVGLEAACEAWEMRCNPHRHEGKDFEPLPEGIEHFGICGVFAHVPEEMRD